MVPSAMVPSPLVALVTLFALLAPLLASCTSDEGTEYDIPAGEQVQDLRLEIDADGTPVLLAEVNMFYATNAVLQPWESRYMLANTQSVAYSGTAGGWKRHPFRNLQRYWETRSMLVRNPKEEVQALIADGKTMSMFTRGGGVWNRKAGFRIPATYEYGDKNFLSGGYAILVDADGASQSIADNYKTHSMEVRRSDGTSFALDTIFDFALLSLVSRSGFDMALGIRREYQRPPFDTTTPNPGETGESGLFSYAWNQGAHDPKPRKRKISDRQFSRVFFAKVEGEERMYALAIPDTLAEFSMQGEELAYLRDLDLPIDRDIMSKEETRPDGLIPYGSELFVDPAGCIHYRAILPSTSGQSVGPSGQTIYLHGSTCRAGVDTLRIPLPDSTHFYVSNLTPFRFFPDGGIAAGLTLIRTNKDPNSFDPRPKPSWIHLARLKGRTWEWEKIAEFEGSGEDDPSH